MQDHILFLFVNTGCLFREREVIDVDENASNALSEHDSQHMIRNHRETMLRDNNGIY